MNSVTLSSKGQLVIPSEIRKALHLRAGEKMNIAVSGEAIVLSRPEGKGARLTTHKGRKVLIAPDDAPPMTPNQVKAILADFP